ncbi:Permease of the drug/metabolite transporter (DMT) superfamily [Muriicola jejuensis]|uniref:EamA family transporter n=1 Tax=Muriicola jejuensis TaxID=504488 RepID=A0A6P0UAD0_9FLAO|nr:DMT family transporter [Muriicola jejuensis]NER10175.1 EamA family transporter [Muriicola jejuensis]SMP02516.1 Permease of the drug/metabolite transporter (DMT) superfamily [Muriicola jejuensis]
MSNRTLALFAALGATTIYGLNHTIAKGVMPLYVKPFGFIMIRVLGATALFWALSFVGPRERIEKKDWGRLVLCSLFGMAINMLAFFKGLDLSTPINSSVLVTTTPIIVVVLSALLIKEKIRLVKGLGIVIGLVGALGLIFYGEEIRQDAPNIPLGNLLFLVNSLFFGLYLILAKKLVEKYHPFTLMKWLFLIGIFLNAPLALPEFLEISWGTLPWEAVWKIGFVVLGTTFCTYLFNAFALTQLKASTVSAFVYVQPLVGIVFAVLSGKDQLSPVKVTAALLVCLGVYLVSKKPSPDPSVSS